MVKTLKIWGDALLNWLVSALTEDELGGRSKQAPPVRNPPPIPDRMVVVEVSGGLVTTVYSNVPAVTVCVVDRDNITEDGGDYDSAADQDRDILGFTLAEAGDRLPAVW